MDDQADITLKLSGGPWRLSPWDAKAAYLQLAQVYDPDPPADDDKGREILPMRPTRTEKKGCPG